MAGVDVPPELPEPREPPPEQGEERGPSTPRSPRVRLDFTQAPRPLASVIRPESPDLGRRVALAGMASLVVLGIGLIVGSSGSGAPPVSAASPTASAPTPLALTSAVAPAVVASGNPLADVDAGAPSVVSAPQVQRPPPVWRVSTLSTDPAVEILEGAFGKGPFDAVLAKAGLAAREVKRVGAAFEGIRRAGRGLDPKDTFVLARDRAKGTLLAFELVASPVDVWQIRADEDAKPDAKLVAKKLTLFVEQRPLTAALAVTHDLAKAVQAAGLHDDVLHAVDDALEGRDDALQVHPGVRLRLLGHEEIVEGAYARTRLEALEIVPRTGTGNPLRVYWYERDPEAPGKRRAPAAGFYDAKAQQPFRGAFRSPLPQARITSRFNPKRLHPVLKVVMPHNGIDYGAGTGTPVYASGAGTVILAGQNGPCGNMVEIEHQGGLHTAYCHLSKFAAGLHSGQHVEPRQLVGYVGATGRATGPHLHFAVKRGTIFVDPLSLKMDGVRVLPPVDREVFVKIRAELDAKLDGIALPAAPDAKDLAEKEPKDDEDLHGEE